MKKVFSFTWLCLFLSAFLTVVSAESETTLIRYAEVTQPAVIVREEVDPKSRMVMQAVSGQTFEVIGEGTLWVKVRTDRGDGWIPVSSCRLIEKKSTDILSSSMGTIVLLIILMTAVGLGVFFFLRNHRDGTTVDML